MTTRTVPATCRPHTTGVQVYPPEQLHHLLARADYVILALPGTSETAHIIDAAALAAMKTSAVLINVGRGAPFPGTSCAGTPSLTSPSSGAHLHITLWPVCRWAASLLTAPSS